MIRTRLTESRPCLIRGRNDDSLELIESAFKAVENVMYELRPPYDRRVRPHRAAAVVREEIHRPHRDPRKVRGDETGAAARRSSWRSFASPRRHSTTWRATPGHGTSLLNYGKPGPHIVLTLEDDGVGFDREAKQDGKGGLRLHHHARARGGGGTARSRSNPERQGNAHHGERTRRP